MFSDPTNIVGSRIRAVRTQLGLSQEALAERLHVTRQTVSNRELGRNLPDIEALKALAEALEVPVEQLIYQEGRSPSRLARFPLDVWCRRLGIFVLVWGLLSGIRAGSGSGIMSDGGVGFVFTWRAALSVWYTALIRGSILLALGRVLTLLQDREPGGSPAESLRKEAICMNRVLEKYRVGQSSVGTFTHLRSSVAVEALGTAGLDFVVLDTEHCVLNPETMAECITAAGAAGLDALVRIHSVTREAVLHPLDLGAKGLIVPAVETVEEVERLVRFAKFPPVGGRGFCPTRDGLWGCDEASLAGAAVYMDRSNRETLLIPQCETAGCLANIETIAAMEGVDGIFVGPLDLSIALGCPMELDAPQMREALARVVAACKAAGKLAMIFCGDAETARKRLAAGFDSAALGLDVLALIQSYRAMAEAVRG